jgi:RNA polymerase sigma factor (sigma-70 family)
MTDDQDRWDWELIRKRCAAEAARIMRRHHEAEEVVQEALARAWRSRHACRTPEAPLPWCLQITRNEAFRRIGRHRGVTIIPLESGEETEDRAAGLERERSLARVDVHRALHKLTAREQLLIALRYGADCSHPEIAASLEIPEATARVQLHRAHKRLRSLLGERP